MRRAPLAVVLALTAVSATAGSTLADDPGPAAVARGVVAVVGEQGLNVLHEEFATSDGGDPVYPPGMPTPVRVELPRTGTFEQRLEVLRAGVLADLRPGVLYAIAGTRLLVIAPVTTRADDTSDTDVVGSEGGVSFIEDLRHGTGVIASAIGRRTGTAPDALAVLVTGSYDSPAAWDWVSRQSWVDVASVSGYSVSTPVNGVCRAGPEVRRAVADGLTVFSSSGNATDLAEQAVSPNGLPEVHQVGGVDSDGQTRIGPDPSESDPAFAVAGGVTRPYVTGGLYSYETAAGDSLDGLGQFGGTSGATPRTAGFALQLIAHARSLLGGAAGPAHASLAPSRTPPAAGPLTDGDLTHAELTRLLRHTARPFEPASPGRYLVEGYGYVDAAAVEQARRVLDGTAPEPQRLEEDRVHDAVVTARAALFHARC